MDNSITADSVIASYKRGQYQYSRMQVEVLIKEIERLEKEARLLQESIWNVGEWVECPKCHHQSPPEYVCLSCGYDHSIHKVKGKKVQDVEGL